MSINDCFAAYLVDLRDGEIADPLGARLTLAMVWHDLALLAGEPVPDDVAALVDAPPPLLTLRAVPKGRGRRVGGG